MEDGQKKKVPTFTLRLYKEKRKMLFLYRPNKQQTASYANGLLNINKSRVYGGRAERKQTCNY